jgi:hypothetical protein
MSDAIMNAVIPTGFISDVIPKGAEGPVRDFTVFASVNAANGTIPAAGALPSAGREFPQ